MNPTLYLKTQTQKSTSQTKERTKNTAIIKTDLPARNPYSYCQVYFKKHKDARLLLEKSCLNFGWQSSTLNLSIAYFLNSFLDSIVKNFPKSNLNSAPLSPSEFGELQEYLIKKAKRHGRSKNDTNCTAINIFAQVERCKKIYDVACYLILENENIQLPDLPCTLFAPSKTMAKVSAECCKELPHPVRLNLGKILKSSIDQGPALGVAAMLMGGLRPSEATPLRFSDIDVADNLVRTKIIKTEHNGQFSDGAKSVNGIRWVIFHPFFRILLDQKIQYLKEKGYASEQIQNFPIASLSLDEKTPCSEQSVSALGRIFLSQAKLDPQVLAAAALYSAMDKEDDGDVATYVFRRDFASICVNYCGISEPYIHHLLGHSSGDCIKVDMNNHDQQTKIFNCLNRFVFDEETTTNPSFKPVSIGNDEIQFITPFSSYRIEQNHQPVELAFSATEPGQIINIKLPAGCPAPTFQLYQTTTAQSIFSSAAPQLEFDQQEDI